MLQCLDPMTPQSEDTREEACHFNHHYSPEDIIEEDDIDQQQEIRAIAEQLQHKLAIKAEKLRMLQVQRQQSKYVDDESSFSDNGSCRGGGGGGGGHYNLIDTINREIDYY